MCANKNIKWIKKIYLMSDNIVRTACLPDNIKEVSSTFAVKEPEKFKEIKLQKKGNQLIFKNNNFKITMIDDGKKFSKNNLKIEWSKKDKNYTWSPGTKDNENLGGPHLSLDYARKEFFPDKVMPYDASKGIDSYVCNPFMMVRVFNKSLKKKLGKAWDDPVWQKELENFLSGKKPEFLDEWDNDIINTYNKVKQFPPSFLSKNGMCVFLDDSLPWNNKEQWIEKLPEIMPEIYYFIYYDNNYKNAVKYLTEVMGKIPEIPEWILGIWFSCYRIMGEKDFVQTKKNFEKYNLPLDMLVVDTDWHKLLWHGFDWNKKLFPNPKRFANWLKKENVHASFNVHPQFIPKGDTRVKEFINKTGVPEIYLDRESAPHPLHSDCLSVNLFDKKQAIPYFDIFHKPIEETGCDIWWIDGTLTDERGRESTTWLNEVYFNNSNKSPEKETSVVFSRTFGLGSHRASIPFSADTFSQWKVLEQEVIYTSMSANALLAYISHDIGGFIKGSPDWKENKLPDDLFIRWTQFGCLSPIMRYHSDHGIREPWKYSKKTLKIVRNFLHFRKCLMPYLINLVKEAHKNGIALCRPMYYEFPDENNAYNFKGQYMLGEALLIAPVVNENNISKTWLPPGRWAHCLTERIITGPAVIEEKIPAEIMPVYIREGYDIEYFKFNAKNKYTEHKKKNTYKFNFSKGTLASQMGIDFI